jgi:hypothetical protein
MSMLQVQREEMWDTPGALEKGLIMMAAVDDEASGQCRSDPTILDQSTVYSWSQDSFTTSGMVAAPSDELHRASYGFTRMSAPIPKSAQNYAHC